MGGTDKLTHKQENEPRDEQMKTIGLLGGMSWESTQVYYRIINETVKERLGGLHSAKCALVSVDFGQIESLQHQDKWPELTAIMIDAAKRVERAGADFLLICTNTMHKMAHEVEAAIGIALLHIVDATAQQLLDQKIKRAVLLGTKFTMEEPFYKERLTQKYGIDVMVPDRQSRQVIHEIIYDELCRGDVSQHSRKRVTEIIADQVSRGGQGIILGCTELPLLIGKKDLSVPVFDTTRIHAQAAVARALKV